MKVLKIIVLSLLAVFVGIQFIPTIRNQSDTVPISDFMTVHVVPKPVEIIFKTACYDCHSNHTDYPWYHKIQPVAWMLERHITAGKKELNLSEFGMYSSRKQKSTLNAIANQIKDGEMPLWSYTLMHRNAKLSEKDKAVLLLWLDKMIGE